MNIIVIIIKELIDVINNYSDDILSVEQIGETLFIGRNAVYKLLNSGELKAFRIGKTWKIPNAALIEFISKKSGVTIE